MSSKGTFSVILQKEHIQQQTHHKTQEVLSALYQDFTSLFNAEWNETLPLTSTHSYKSQEFKVRRAFSLEKLQGWVDDKFPNVQIKGFSKSFRLEKDGQLVARFIEGEGARNRSAGGGHAGKKFEVELAECIQGKNFVHQELKELILQKCGLVQDSLTVTVDGSKNQKRGFHWDGKKVAMNPSGDIGKIVTDVTLSDTQGNQEYLSLKWGPQYFLANMSMRQLLDLGTTGVSTSRDAWLKWIGFNPKKFCEPYGLQSEITRVDDASRVAKRWEKILSEVIGYGYTYVVGGVENPKVIKLTEPSKVTVYKVIEKVYALQGVRKCSRIRLLVNILGEDRIVDVQFRGTEATETLPNYMRILLTKNNAGPLMKTIVR